MGSLMFCHQRLWCVVAAVLASSAPAHCRNVTNEDIHSAMVSLVNIFRNSEDQLQRHELRERALGEQVKKTLSSIEKKQRALEPTKGMVSRLDERLSNVETILLQKEEREKANQKVTQDALGEIQRSLQSLAATVTRNLNSVPTDESVENNLTTNDESVEKRLDATDTKIDAIKMEIENLKNILSRESLQALCPQAAPQSNQLERHISETEDLLIKYELKLLEYGNCSKTSVDDLPLGEVTMADEAWHSKMTEVMERQEVEVKKIQELLSDAESMWKDLPRLSDLHTSTNQTLEAIISAKGYLLENYNTSLDHVSRQQRETSERLMATNGDLQQVLTQSNTMNERAYSELGRNLDAVLNEVQKLTTNEEILLQTADNVISTKNSVDYGVQHILQEVSELLNIQHKTMNRSIQERFENVQKVILTNQTVAIRNLSSNIDSEMLNLWRQMGNMYQQLTVNKITLDKLSELTELYVNGTGIIMSNMTDKMTTIASNMWQMDDNLNYLLGKLSLVSQEFNRIKTGLGEALDQLRASFLRTQAQLSEIGPGPHPIANADKTKNNAK